MTNKTFTAHGVSDLLDLVPALFGFEPHDSFIAIAVHGENSRFGFRLRLDVPPLEFVAQAADQVAGHLLRQCPDGVILLALTERSREADALIAGVGSRMGDVPVYEAVRCDGTAYWIHGPDGPGRPTPYRRQCSPLVVEAVTQGQAILPDRDALVARFAAVAGERKDVMEDATAQVLSGALRELAAGPGLHLGVVGLARLGPIMLKHAEGEVLDDQELATLAIWVSSRDVRDAVWSQFRCDNADAALRLWTEVAQSVVDPFEAPVLCLAGFAAWLSGDGSQALIAAERALAKEPEYEMGVLILRILDAGVSPSAWDGFDPEPPAVAA